MGTGSMISVLAPLDKYGIRVRSHTRASISIRVFVQFRLSDQLRSSADQINDFGVVNVADSET
ncbi:hypothetical protein MTR_4g045813 [Medicago truncatula]|uniref:Uncharacterized protein n=1 Tax=Medicago truncatula TaxID=3880 RepID=A0A072UKG6_MEDTR|nr:hypothetical protein MTR_4g045813 [Medicago truncatula]